MRLFYLITILFYVIGTLSSAYVKRSSDFYLMNCLINLPYYDSIRNVFFLGIPFFACGYIVHVIRSKIKKVSLGVVFFGVLTVVEIAFVHIKLENSFIITFALYPFVIFILLYLLKHPYANMRMSSDSCRKISGFVYYAHPFVIFILNLLFSLSETPMFICASMISTILGILIVKTNNKYLMKLL